MRNFKNINPEDKVWLKFHVTAQQAAVLQQEAKSRGLTMSSYMAVLLQNMVDSYLGNNQKQEN